MTRAPSDWSTKIQNGGFTIQTSCLQSPGGLTVLRQREGPVGAGPRGREQPQWWGFGGGGGNVGEERVAMGGGGWGD